jgi:SAM-dependent methyltransferase
MPVPPTKSFDFDSVYRSRIYHWMWSDPRIPSELKELIAREAPRTVLELGCGLGRFSRYVAEQGVRVTGVDFSEVAIAKAQARVARDEASPQFVVGDVTHLDAVSGPFDVAFDVGCFHCLNPEAQRAYASEVSRLLKPGGTHLIWALHASPSGMPLSPQTVEPVFAATFQMQRSRKSRRRLVRSHWYWLVRSDN